VARIAILVHGAGSCVATVRRLLAPAVPDDVATVVVDARGSVDDVVRRLREAASGSEVVLAAGVSLGAHAVALWSLEGGKADALLLVMPAWSGAPDDVAALTSATADAIEARGRDSVLEEVRALAPADWVVRELTEGWATYTDAQLAAALRSAGASRAPNRSQLGRIVTPAAVVALADDPVHPEAVAHAWAAALPRAVLETVARDAPGRDIGALGLAGRRALARLHDGTADPDALVDPIPGADRGTRDLGQ
jgi:pimeloyl-ACP methyl ester carboxylesterase